MTSDSMLYTIGTALRRAQDTATGVEILVEGQWVAGDVVALDGHGVVLASERVEHSVIRMSSVSAVRVRAAAPFQRPPSEPQSGSAAYASATPLPSPRVPHD